MGAVNKLIIVGYLGADPERRDVNGQELAVFSVATTEKWRRRDGEPGEHTEWHSVQCWGKLAEIALRYLHKGSQVYVEGSVRTSKWEKDGQEHRRTVVNAKQVVFLGSKGQAQGQDQGYGGGGGGGGGGRQQQQRPPQQQQNQQRAQHRDVNYGGDGDGFDEDIPF